MRLRYVLGAVYWGTGARSAGVCFTCIALRAPGSGLAVARRALTITAGTRNGGDGESVVAAGKDFGHLGGGKRASRRGRVRSVSSRTLDFSSKKATKKTVEAAAAAKASKRPPTPALDALGGIFTDDTKRGESIVAALVGRAGEVSASLLYEAVSELYRLKTPELARRVFEEHKAAAAWQIDPNDLGTLAAAMCRSGDHNIADSLAASLWPASSTVARPSRVYASLVMSLLKNNHVERAETTALRWRDAERAIGVQRQDDEGRPLRADADAAATPAGAVRYESPPPVVVFNNALRFARKARTLRAVFAVIEAMRGAGVVGDDDTYAEISNAAARSVDFVAGAVSMESMPPADRGEAVLVGRSNVGKSSLVNMLCNRKALAFISKKPGKTQQFNYFAVNSASSNEWRPPGKFYVVDVPGLGYAKVAKSDRVAWRKLIEDYLSKRDSVKVVFHLIDSRLDSIEAVDLELFELVKGMMSERPWRYIIVLTKADKVIRNSQSERLLEARIAHVQKALEETLGVDLAAQTEIVVTSSVSRRGRDAMWQGLQPAIDYVPPPTPSGYEV